MQSKFSLHLTTWIRILIACASMNVSCTRTDHAPTTLNLVLVANVKALDPALINDRYMHAVASQIYEPLLTYDYFADHPTLIPLISTSLPEISKDGLTYTFHIKNDIRFQNDECFPDGKGRLLKAEDFIYSWKRIADKANVSENFWLLDNHIVGLNQWREQLALGKAKFSDPIEGLKALNPSTLVIKLLRPDFQLNYAFAMPQLSAVPHEAVEHYGREFLNHPVGTGPYALKEWVHNNKITLVKNQNYRDVYFPKNIPGMQVDEGKKLPLLDTIKFNELVEDQSRWLNFMKGNLDISGIPKDDFDSAVDRKTKTVIGELKQRGVRISRQLEPNVVFRVFNMDDPFFGKHQKVRQAMSLADDRPTGIDKFYNGRGTVPTMPIPPNVDGFDSKFKNTFTDFNFEAAKKLLADAGFAGGKGIPEITYEITNSTTGRQEAEFFQHNMATIGIRVLIHTNSWPELTEKSKMRKAQLLSLAWSADYPDAENFFQLLYSKNASPGSNGANYNNPEFDSLYEKAMAIPPGKLRNVLYLRMAEIVRDDCPWILVLYREDFFLSQNWVRNFKANGWASGAYQFVGIDDQKRVEQTAKF